MDADRKRISLTMRLDDKVSDKPAYKKAKAADASGTANKAGAKAGTKPAHKAGKGKGHKPKDPANAAMGNAFADAFAKLKK